VSQVTVGISDKVTALKKWGMAVDAFTIPATPEQSKIHPSQFPFEPQNLKLGNAAVDCAMALFGRPTASALIEKLVTEEEKGTQNRSIGASSSANIIMSLAFLFELEAAPLEESIKALGMEWEAISKISEVALKLLPYLTRSPRGPQL
jgi:hypothetical protein